MGRPFFPLFFKDRGKLKYLSMEQRGQLLTALFDYAADGNVPEMDGLTGFAFEVFREGIDTSLAKYEDTCRKRQEAAKKGAAARWGKKDDMPNGIPIMPNASDRMPNDSKNAETEDRSRSQKTEAEDEVEDEDRSQKQNDAAELTDAEKIRQCFYDRFGREPSREFLRSAAKTGFSADIVCAAIDKSIHADKPEGYATNVLRNWQQYGAPKDAIPHRQQTSMPEDWEAEWRQEFEAMQREEELK